MPPISHLPRMELLAPSPTAAFSANFPIAARFCEFEPVFEAWDHSTVPRRAPRLVQTRFSALRDRASGGIPVFRSGRNRAFRLSFRSICESGQIILPRTGVRAP
jgi:hypothetical protein